MKKALILPALLAAWSLLIAATPATAANDSAADTNTLQVHVRIPPTWEPLLEDRVTERFVDQIRELFRRQGYTGEVKEVHEIDRVNASAPLLTIFLTEWQMGHTGHITCTFTAGVQSPQGMRTLGMYIGTSLRWMSGPGRFGMADSLDQAATAALRQLYDDIAETDLVPGLKER